MAGMAQIFPDFTDAIQTVPVWESPFCTLLHFRPERRRAKALPRILVVAPLSGHRAGLMRETVASLLPDADVLLACWEDAAEVPCAAGPFGLDENIDHLIALMRHLGPDIHVLGVSQAPVPILAATALMAQQDDPAQPRSVTLIAGFIDPRLRRTGIGQLVRTLPLAWFEKVVTAEIGRGRAGAGRRVYPAAYQSYAMHRYLHRHLATGGELQQKIWEPGFVQDFLDLMDLHEDFFLDTVRRVFRDAELACGTLIVKGERVESAAILHTALMTVEGGRDDVSGAGQTQAAHDLCPNVVRREHVFEPFIGHFGGFRGAVWREGIQPRVMDFIRKAEAPRRRKIKPPV